jgi:chemotaxis-related protein WspB
VLFLLLQLDGERYALDTARISEVLPLIKVKPMLHAPAGVVGTINVRGAFIPVVDLGTLALGRPSPHRLSTRIVLTRLDGEGETARLIGLIAEHATETFRAEASDFIASGLSNPQAPYAGPIANTARGLVQRLDLDRLLPATVSDLLFAKAA